MKTLQYLPLSISFILLASCNIGSSASSNDNTNATIAATAKIAASNQNSCLNITNPSTTLGAWWVNGKFSIANNCSTNQSINGIAIAFSSKSYSLNAKQFSLQNISDIYFGPPKWWAQPTMTFSVSNSNGVDIVTGTIAIADNAIGYIKANSQVTVSFGYNPNGKIPGAFSYGINTITPVPTPSATPTVIPTPSPTPSPITSKILYVDFNNDQAGLYTKNDFVKDWNMNPNQSSGQGSRLNIVYDNNSNNKVLAVTYKANQVGGQSAMTFTPSLSGKNTRLFFQYKVKFANNFNWFLR